MPSDRNFTLGKCAKCRTNDTVGRYTLCGSCYQAWLGTNRSTCPSCGEPKGGEETVLCKTCEDEYRKVKHPLRPVVPGPFKSCKCAKCKGGTLSHERNDLCDDCFIEWKCHLVNVCAVCGSPELEPCNNNPAALRDLCSRCYHEWYRQQPASQRPAFVPPPVSQPPSIPSSTTSLSGSNPIPVPNPSNNPLIPKISAFPKFERPPSMPPSSYPEHPSSSSFPKFERPPSMPPPSYPEHPSTSFTLNPPPPTRTTSFPSFRQTSMSPTMTSSESRRFDSIHLYIPPRPEGSTTFSMFGPINPPPPSAPENPQIPSFHSNPRVDASHHQQNECNFYDEDEF